MGVEIERKYLVVGDYKAQAKSCSHIVQGYLSRERGRTVRVRLRDKQAWLTIKGPSSPDGLSRFEWEYEIPADEARLMLKLCGPALIDKHRYLISWQGYTIEVDEFHGENEGLVLAEIELRSADEKPTLPPFLGREVTGDRRYYNSCLLSHPYSHWNETPNL